jgi:hypothetical protein
MTAGEFLDVLRTRGVVITAEDGFLELDAPEGVLTDELVQEISRHKSELLKLLGESNELPEDAGEVLAALRDYLYKEHRELGHDMSHTRHFEPHFLAINLQLFGYMKNAPAVGQVEAALEVLDVEGGAAA